MKRLHQAIDQLFSAILQLLHSDACEELTITELTITDTRQRCEAFVNTIAKIIPG